MINPSASSVSRFISTATGYWHLATGWNPRPITKSQQQTVATRNAGRVVRQAVRQAHGPERSRRTHHPEQSRRATRNANFGPQNQRTVGRELPT